MRGFTRWLKFSKIFVSYSNSFESCNTRGRKAAFTSEMTKEGGHRINKGSKKRTQVSLLLAENSSHRTAQNTSSVCREHTLSWFCKETHKRPLAALAWDWVPLPLPSWLLRYEHTRNSGLLWRSLAAEGSLYVVIKSGLTQTALRFSFPFFFSSGSAHAKIIICQLTGLAD